MEIPEIGGYASNGAAMSTMMVVLKMGTGLFGGDLMIHFSLQEGRLGYQTHQNY
ncbi:MAG: hypothetical protein RIC06_25730 [Cyclobacteriaceae bacterium]